ncbi:MAG: FAD-dependent oxidoreductase [Proteobacteria bacterium]|nr:FAD-dependent oxidoreductase [Pseudomonadota bacterium]
MAKSFAYATYPYRRSPDQDAAEPAHHGVIVVGAGLVGMAFAVDMALRGHDVLVLDDGDRVSVGSRSICVAKRSLEIFDRLGIGARCAQKGVVWNTGKVLHGDRLLYAFDLQPEQGHRFPAFVNLQQYYVETYLIERFAELGRGELRWKNRAGGVAVHDDHVALEVETPDGPYRLTCDWLVAADGVRSTIRHALDLPFVGESFHDHFLITDVVMHSDMPVERRFWFDPPFHGGKSALLHKQPDDIWRIDLQLGADADREVEMKEEAIVPRLKAMLGQEAAFTIDWSSLYTFQCRRLENFRHGRVLFVGDAAHTVSPFGARGGNGGIQDADNLAWKLAAVLEGRAGEGLLDSYEAERIPAADENILNSTRATDFIAPKNAAMELFREAVLGLADHHAFARGFVNSGRLSVAHQCIDSPLASPDEGDFAGGVAPGCPALDAPLADGWLLERLGGEFVLVLAGIDAAPFAGLPLRVLVLEPDADRDGMVAVRYDLAGAGAYLFRPDQHVAARFRAPTAATVAAALQRAMGQA